MLCSMGVALTTWEIMDDRARMIEVLTDVFEEVGTDHCLVGGIAVGYHAQPRATVDVDMLVPRRKAGRIARALEARGYVITRHPGMIRVYPAGATPGSDESIADLVENEANPTLRAISKSTEPATVLGLPVRIATRGALVAAKFHAAVSPHRSVLDRQQDLVDMGRVITKAFTPEDEETALAIAETMHPGAREELARVIADHRAGRPVTL